MTIIELGAACAELNVEVCIYATKKGFIVTASRDKEPIWRLGNLDLETALTLMMSDLREFC